MEDQNRNVRVRDLKVAIASLVDYINDVVTAGSGSGGGSSTGLEFTALLKANYDAAYSHSQVQHAPANAEQNVQADWNVTDAGSDAFIKNKPTIPQAYNLPTASTSQLGGIKVGAGLSINNGVLSANGGGTADSIDWSNVQNKPDIPTVTNDLTNALKTNYDAAYSHSQAVHAPSNAQKNSEITKAEIEAKLIGNITTHTHTQVNEITIQKITQAQYDALASKDANTLYIITQ